MFLIQVIELHIKIRQREQTDMQLADQESRKFNGLANVCAWQIRWECLPNMELCHPIDLGPDSDPDSDPDLDDVGPVDLQIDNVGDDVVVFESELAKPLSKQNNWEWPDPPWCARKRARNEIAELSERKKPRTRKVKILDDGQIVQTD